jgi:Parvulin-like peptidyl-prolyl isomerase
MEKRHSVKEEKKATPIFVKYGLIALAAIVVIVAGVLLYLNLSVSYIATVGNEKISTSEYKFYLELQKQSMLYTAQQADPNLNADTFWNTKISAGKTALEYAKERAMDTAQNTKVQLAIAKENGISLTSDETKAIDTNITSNIINNTQVGSGSRSKAEKYMKTNYGCSLNDFKQIQIEQEIISKYETQVKKKFGVTTDKIKEYYDKNPDWYKESVDFRTGTEEAAWARHILINVASDATQETKDAAKKKAQDILDKLKAGEDFAKLAKENSEDTGSAQYGGEYIFGKGRMDKNFENAAFSLNPGQLDESLVETTYGYHIIKLEEKFAKDQPVSLRCATEFHSYGTSFIENKLYQAKVEEWKKDTKFKFSKVDSVYKSIS